MNFSKFTYLKEDIITSDKILWFVNNLGTPYIEYIKTDFIKNRIKEWKNTQLKILISGHSDYDINNTYLDIFDKCKNLKLWLCENKNIIHPNISSIPIGISNGTNRESLEYLYNLTSQPKKIKNIAYLNITIKTYKIERQKVIDLYANQSWVTYEPRTYLKNFYEQIYNHKFIFAPRGNGIDTHRLWEALYLKSIPIVKRTIGMEEFEDLPILFIDNWENIDEKFLNDQYEYIMNKSYNFNKLKLDYWCNKIVNILNSDG